MSIAGTSQSSITSAVVFDETKTRGSLRASKADGAKQVMFADQDTILTLIQNQHSRFHKQNEPKEGEDIESVQQPAGMRELLPKYKTHVPEYDEMSKTPGNMVNLVGQPLPNLFLAATEGLLMDPLLKSNTQGRHYLQRTACRLFNTEICSVIHMLGLDGLTDNYGKKDSRAALEMCNHLQIIEIDQGQQIPIKMEGMFIVLQGKVTATTHWKLDDGMGVSQQQYQVRTRHQHANLQVGFDKIGVNAQKEAQKSDKPNLLTTAITRKLHTKHFEDLEKNNPYLKQIKCQLDKKPTQIPSNTTHCAPELTKLLINQANSKFNSDRGVISQGIDKLIEQENQLLERLTEQNKDSEGYGHGTLPLGTCLQQGVMFGASQYLLHYKFEVQSEKAVVAYMARNNHKATPVCFEDVCKNINTKEIELIAAYLKTTVPAFKFQQISNTHLRKIVKSARVVQIPKGWTYTGNPESNKFFIVRKGIFQYECNSAESEEFKMKDKEIDLKKVLSYRVNQQRISKQERIIINDKTRLDLHQLKQQQQKKKTQKHKEIILGPGQIFSEETILIKAMKITAASVATMTYTVTCKDLDSEIMIFNVEELFRHIRTEEPVIEELKNSYRQKLPMPRDNTSTFSELYRKLAVRSDDIKPVGQSDEVVAPVAQKVHSVNLNETGLPSRSVRSLLIGIFQPVDKRAECTQIVNDFQYFKDQKSIIEEVNQNESSLSPKRDAFSMKKGDESYRTSNFASPGSMKEGKISPSPDVMLDQTPSGLELNLNEVTQANIEVTPIPNKSRVYMSSKIEGALSYLHTAPPEPVVVRTTGPQVKVTVMCEDQKVVKRSLATREKQAMYPGHTFGWNRRTGSCTPGTPFQKTFQGSFPRSDYISTAPKTAHKRTEEQVKVTNFGVFKANGEFVSSRCSAFEYNKNAYMKMAVTFRNNTKQGSQNFRRSTGFQTANPNQQLPDLAVSVEPDYGSARKAPVSGTHASNGGQMTPIQAHQNIMSRFNQSRGNQYTKYVSSSQNHSGGGRMPAIVQQNDNFLQSENSGAGASFPSSAAGNSRQHDL